MIKIKKGASWLLFLILFGTLSTVSLFAGNLNQLTITGEQVASVSTKGETRLFCPLFVIPQGKVGIITNVSCDGSSFWITDEKKLQTIAHFKEPQKAVGHQLKAGSYYVYPSLSYNKLGRPQAKAKITLTILLK